MLKHAFHERRPLRTGPYDFLVDTGTQITIVSPSLAAELQLKSQDEARVLAVGFETLASFSHLDVIAFLISQTWRHIQRRCHQTAPRARVWDTSNQPQCGTPSNPSTINCSANLRAGKARNNSLRLLTHPRNFFWREPPMRQLIGATILTCAFASAIPASSQVKVTKEQMMFYTSDWKGERFPDGRPRISDDLLKRAIDVSIEDVWEYLASLGYKCQFDGGFQALHPDKPFAGRALTAQYIAC